MDARPWEELAPRAHRNAIESLWTFSLGRAHPRREDWEGAVAIRTDAPARITNVLWVVDPPRDARGLLERADRFFGRRVWRVIPSHTAVATIGPEADRRRWRSHPGEPGMVLDPLPVAPSQGTKRVDRVEGLEAYRHFVTTAAKGFSIPGFALRHVLPSEVPPDRGPARPRCFVGYADDRPVATSAVVGTEGVAGVFFVSTLPEVRGQGWATAVTWAALEEGRTHGCDVGYLEATALGAPVYTRMGFRKVEEYPEWHNRPRFGTGIRGFGQVLRMLMG